MIPYFLSSYIDTIRKAYYLAAPFGRKKLLVIAFLSFIIGVFQVLGVTSIFPFLALASNPQVFRDSALGEKLFSSLPPFSDQELLIGAGIFAVAMLVLVNAFNLLGDFMRHRYAQNFGHWLKLRLLQQIVARPYADFLQENTGTLIKKVQGDVSQFTQSILLNLLDQFSRVITMILLSLTLFYVQPQMTIVAGLSLSLFYILFYLRLGRWRLNASEQLKLAGRGAFVQIQQFFSGIKPVKVHRAENFFISQYSRHSSAMARLNALIPVVANTPRYLIEPLAFGGLVVAVLFFIERGQDLTLILPSLGVMALAGYKLLPAVQLLYAQMSTLSVARHALDEVYSEFLLGEQMEGRESGSGDHSFLRPGALTWEREIRLDHVVFKYEGSSRAVIDGLSINIPKNSSLGIIGPTGSGKSTLVDLILGLHIPTSGGILADETPLTSQNRRAWRAGIGYVPQDIFLLDDTITANVAFGIPPEDVDFDAVSRAAEAAQISEFIKSDLPEGYNTVVGERGVRLSGGQRQRIGLARALYHQPNLLILDEATSALDLKTEAEVMNAINDLQGSITIIMIAHRLSTVSECDRILNVADGSVSVGHDEVAT